MCIEIALWDRFPGWGPEQTSRFSMSNMRVLFALLEQQRVAKDYRENVGPGSPERLNSLLVQKNLTEASHKLEKTKSLERMETEAARIFGSDQ